MSGFDPTTPVTFTMRHIFSAVWFVITAGATVIIGCALVVWVVVSFTIGGMRDDVKRIRDEVQALQAGDKTNVVSLQGTENRITDRLAKLDSSFTILSGKLDTTNAKLEAVNASIDALSKRLDAVAPGDERRRRR